VKQGVRYLPFAFSQSSELARAIRSATQDPARRAICDTCGGRVPIRRDLPEQIVRCPHCWRRQHVVVQEDRPWRLSPEAAAALKRTRRWVRL